MVNQALIRTWLYEQGCNVVIATDGSIRENVTAWAGAVWRDNSLLFEWSAAREGSASSYRAECEAFRDALAWIQQHAEESDRIAILTDSLSLVSRLEKRLMPADWWDVIRNVPARILISYIPGHSGISFNEKADALAGAAEPFGQLIRTPEDVMAELSLQVTSDEELQQNERWEVQRLIEHGWIRGDGRSLLERGRDRVLKNQLELGTVSRATLRTLIEGGGPEKQPAPLLLCWER